ncbi:MAG: hypothetical protein J6V05_01165 [Alistipes sp.]|nr:hypothetical protein [Alistipes sp.]
MTSITIYNPTGEDVHEASITKDARVFRQLGGDYYVEVPFSVADTLALPKGSYILVSDPTTSREEKYALRSDATPEPISGVNGYKYVLKFYSRQHDMEACQIKWLAGGSQELSFRVTTSLKGFAKLIADNMNKYLGFTDDTEVTDAADAWLYDGTLDDTDMREQLFEGVSCWDAINNIANAFGVEWWVDHGEKLTIHFGKCENEGVATDIREGEIVNRFPAPKRGDDSNYGTRFYIFGGTQNVPENYRERSAGSTNNTTFHIAEKRICLRRFAENGLGPAEDYIPAFDAIPNLPQAEIVEKTIILNEVFPKNETTIREGDILKQDENIIEGEEKQPVYYIKVEKKPIELSTLGITFTSGALSGRSFGAAYTTQLGESYIKVLHTTENSGGASLIAVPNANLAPKAEDKYILTGVELDEDRITAAERELWKKGTELARQRANDTNVYDCPVDPVHCTEKKVNLALGDKVILKGAHFGEDGRRSRIQGYEKKLYNQYIATYNIGDNSVYSRTAKVVKDIQLPVAEAVASTERKNVQFSAQISSMQSDLQLTSILQRLNDIEGYDTDTAESTSIPGAKAYADQQANTARLNAIDKATSDIKRDIKQGIQGVTKFSIVAGTQFVGKPHSVDPNLDVKGIYVATNSVFDNVYGITSDDKLQFNYDPYHQNYDLALKITASDASKYDGAIIGIISDVAAEVLMTQTHLAQGDVIMAVGGSWVKISNTNATSGDGNGQMFGGTIENRATYVVGEPSTQQLWVIPSEEYRTKHKLSSTITEFEVTDDDFLASDHKGEYFVVKRAGGIVSSFIDGFVWEGVQYDVGDWLVALPYGWKKINGSDVGGSNGGIQPYFIDEVSISQLIELYGTGHPMTQISEGLYDAVWSAMSQGNPVYIRYYEGVDDSWILLNLVYEDLIYFSCVDASSNIITGEISSDSISINDITDAIALKDLMNDFNQDIGELYNIKQDVITDLDYIREGKVYVTRFNLQTLISGSNIPITTAFVKAMNDKKVILVPYSTRGGYVIANVIQCAALESNINILLQIYDGAILYSIWISSTMPATEVGVPCTATVTKNTLIRQTDVKTINGQSILGSGDITISGGGSTLTEDDIANMGFTKNVGTVTSVAGVVPESDGVISSLSLHTQLSNGRVQKVSSPPRTLYAGYVYVVTDPVYNIGITNLTLTANNTVEEYTMHFVTSSSGASCNIAPAGKLYWAGGKPTALPADTYYELSIIKITISGSSYFKAVLTPFV